MTYPDIPEPAQHVGRPPEAPLDGPGGTPQSPPLTQRGPTTRSAPGAAAEAPPGSGQPESGQDGSGTSAEALPGSDQHGSGTTSGAKEQGKQVAQDAKEQAKHVAQDAKESGKQVAQTTQEEVRNVGATVSEQVRNLLSETSSEISSQAGSQQQRLAEGLRALSHELSSMAQGSNEPSSQATGLVREASQRTQGLADWFEHHEPGDVLTEVKRFARRKPGTFIAVAAGVGLVAGRMTRSLASDQGEGRSAAGDTAYTGSAGGVSTVGGAYPPPVVDTGGTATGADMPDPRPPVGPGPVDPGPMSGIGAGPTGGYASRGRSDARSPSDLEADEMPVYGDDPR